jgi:hypothetical protein
MVALRMTARFANALAKPVTRPDGATGRRFRSRS